MNGLFRRILLVCMTIGMVVGFAACDKENDEPDKPVVEQPGDNEKPDAVIYPFVRPLTMSCHEHKNVLLAELRSNISDLKLSFGTAPEGYDEISFIKEDEKDSHGFYVYRVYVNMDEVDELSQPYTNQGISMNGQCKNVKIKLAFTGTGYENGKEKPTELKIEVPVTRYLKGKYNILEYGYDDRYFYLREHRVIPFQNVVSWNEELGEYELNEGYVNNYEYSSSPLIATINESSDLKDNGWDPRYFSFERSEELFGWSDYKEFLGTPYLENGNLVLEEFGKGFNVNFLSINTERLPHMVSAVTVLVNVMVCSADEYDEDGNFVAQHIYTFESNKQYPQN